MPDGEYARTAPDIVASGKGRMVSWCSPVARRGSCEPLADTAQVSSIWRRNVFDAVQVITWRSGRRQPTRNSSRTRRSARRRGRASAPLPARSSAGRARRVSVPRLGASHPRCWHRLRTTPAHIRPGSDQRSEAGARARDVFLSGAHHGARRLRLVMERGRLGRPEVRRVGHALLSSVDAFVDFFESALAGDGLAFDSGADGRGRSPVGHAGP